MDKVIKVTYYGDAGHGWYRVKRDVLAQLGLLEEISYYSYVRGASIYLEEDRDASLFFDKLRDVVGVAHVTKHAKRTNHSPIRSFERYQKPSHNNS